MNVRLALALLPMVLGGCGTQVAQDASGGRDAGDDPPAVNVANGQRTVAEDRSVRGLTCRSDMRVDGTLDYISSTGGMETPQEAADALARTQDDVVIQSRSRSRATVFLLRPNGTAHTRLGVVVLDDGTWRVETVESCSGVHLFGR